MTNSDLIFAFDVGKGSLGVCVRQGDRLLALKSLLVPVGSQGVEDFAGTKDLRERRRAYRTRLAHQLREHWLDYHWRLAGLDPLAPDAPEMTREFPARGDNTLYNSAGLRVALILGQPLASWQIYKALRAAIQRRGYKHLDYQGPEATLDADTQENLESVTKYKEDLHYYASARDEHSYPCFLDAALLGLWWDEATQVILPKPSPEILNRDTRTPYHPDEKPRRKARVAPRELVENEVRALVRAAKQQLPQLADWDENTLLYGPFGVFMPSVEAPQRALSTRFKLTQCAGELTEESAKAPVRAVQLRGRLEEGLGLLGQKAPRFDNKIIAKCRVLEKRNVCRASAEENERFVLLLQLKHLRFTDIYGERRGLTREELPRVFQACWEEYTQRRSEGKGNVTKTTLKKALRRENEGKDVVNLTIDDGLKISTTGRSRFSRPALKMMSKILEEGIDPPDLDVAPYITSGAHDPITVDELQKGLRRLGKTWETFSPGDARAERFEDTQTLSDDERHHAVMKLIGESNNPVVRHRLMVLYNELRRLSQAHGNPARVILEFPRGGEGLEGQKSAKEFEDNIKANEKRNDECREKIKEYGFEPSQRNLERYKLWEEQGRHCFYTGQPIPENTMFSNEFQVDHIVPASESFSSDASYNKVLVYRDANVKKGPLTPYEWFRQHGGTNGYPTDHAWWQDWKSFKDRVEQTLKVEGKKIKSRTRRKLDLLLSANARELLEGYNALAETAWIARLAQQMVALYFGRPLQIDADVADKKRFVFVNDGLVTSAIRRQYQMNEWLWSAEERQKLAAEPEASKRRLVLKKNRDNPKHHALDAFCISLSQEYKPFKRDDGRTAWRIGDDRQQLIEALLPQIRTHLENLVPQPTVRNLKELYPRETIYGYRQREGKHYLVYRVPLLSLLTNNNKPLSLKDMEKKLGTLWDKALVKHLTAIVQQAQSPEAVLEAIKHTCHPVHTQVPIRTVTRIEKEGTTGPEDRGDGRLVWDEFVDMGKPGKTLGQFRRQKKGHQGQILIKNEKGRWEVRPVYFHESLKRVKQELQAHGVEVYQEALFTAGCLIEITRTEQGKQCPPGVYQLVTIMHSGQVKIQDSSGMVHLTSVAHLTQAGLKLFSPEA